MTTAPANSDTDTTIGTDTDSDAPDADASEISWRRAGSTTSRTMVELARRGAAVSERDGAEHIVLVMALGANEHVASVLGVDRSVHPHRCSPRGSTVRRATTRGASPKSTTRPGDERSSAIADRDREMVSLAWAALHGSGTERADVDSIAVGTDAATSIDLTQALHKLLDRPMVQAALPEQTTEASKTGDTPDAPTGAADSTKAPAAHAPGLRAALVALVVVGVMVAAGWFAFAHDRGSPQVSSETSSTSATSIVDESPRVETVDPPTSAASATSATAAAPAGPATGTADPTTDGALEVSLPVDCPTQAEVFACIADVTAVEGILDIGFVSSQQLAYPDQGQLSGFPAFYFDTTQPPPTLHSFDQPPAGLRRADPAGAFETDGLFVARFGPSSAAGPDAPLEIADAPDGATQVCVVVYVPIDTLDRDSGNCVALPQR